MTRILAIDPGPTESAYVVTDGQSIYEHGKVANSDMLFRISKTGVSACVCERIRCMGMAVGAEVLETAEWCGRFQQNWNFHDDPDAWYWITRNEEKMNLCGTPRAKDANIRQAIIDRFGGKDKGIGKKSNPGPLFGIAGDVWAAMAVALTWMDTKTTKAA